MTYTSRVYTQICKLLKTPIKARLSIMHSEFITLPTIIIKALMPKILDEIIYYYFYYHVQQENNEKLNLCKIIFFLNSEI